MSASPADFVAARQKKLDQEATYPAKLDRLGEGHRHLAEAVGRLRAQGMADAEIVRLLRFVAGVLDGTER